MTTLWDQPPAPHNGTETSRRAAAMQSPAKLGEQCRRVLYAVAASGPNGMTRHEVAERLGIKLQAVCGRARELVKAGRLAERRENGKYVTRETDDGGTGKVLVMPEFEGEQ